MNAFLAAEAGIRQLHARCADAVWRKDSTAFMDCFVQDSVWKIAGLQVRGRAQIGRQFEALVAANLRVLMRFGLPVLEVGKGEATGRTDVIELIKRMDGQAQTSIGIYYEHFVDEGERWRFRWRHFDFHYLGRPDLSEPFYPCPEYGPPPALPAEDDPTAGFRVTG
jgi:ketosteroid isomerase-like protein